MQITLDRKSLVRALTTVQRNAPRRMSVTACAYARLTVTCSDAGEGGEVAIPHTIP